MAVNTPIKRSAALRFGRGPTTRPPSGSFTAFIRASGLGCYFIESVESPPTYTTRLILIGASQQRLSLNGASDEMLILEGVSVSRLSLVGSSP
jgi:hypothetical protein